MQEFLVFALLIGMIGVAVIVGFFLIKIIEHLDDIGFIEKLIDKKLGIQNEPDDVEWTRDVMGTYRCSHCSKPAICDPFGNPRLTEYCPNCGKKMRR